MPDTETIAISFESVDTDFPVVLGSEVLAGIERIQVDRFHQLQVEADETENYIIHVQVHDVS